MLLNGAVKDSQLNTMRDTVFLDASHIRTDKGKLKSHV